MRKMSKESLLSSRIWDAENRDFISKESFLTGLKLARFVLLGEIHTNIVHHSLQAEIIDKLSGDNRRPAICFEMMDITCQNNIDDYLRHSPHDSAEFGNVVGWDLQWNPGYEMYKPIFEIALLKNLPVVAANVPRILAKKVVSDGLGALTPDIINNLGLDQSMPPESQQELINEIWESHFGQTEHNRNEFQGLLEGMALAQKLRDATMAYVMLHNQKSKYQILIAGNGHVRNDRGIPYRLVNLGVKENQIASVGLIEMEILPEYSLLPEHREWLKDKKFPYAFVIFTPGHAQ